LLKRGWTKYMKEKQDKPASRGLLASPCAGLADADEQVAKMVRV